MVVRLQAGTLTLRDVQLHSNLRWLEGAEPGPAWSLESRLWCQEWTKRGKSRPHISAQTFLRGEGGREGELKMKERM